MKSKIIFLLVFLLSALLIFSSCEITFEKPSEDLLPESSELSVSISEEVSEEYSSGELCTPKQTAEKSYLDYSLIPTYSGSTYTEVNENIPTFDKNDITAESYEYYSELDYLGRCGVCVSCVGKDIMPTGKRESISSVKPSGWINVAYDIVSGKYLYNRSHLIGWQLTGENANEKNLITGTRYMNEKGMLPFENMIADYVKETGNHVLYRVTPIFIGTELVARGVHMEAYSVEDNGDGIMFNVYVYNVQPGIFIDYSTGKSHLLSEENIYAFDILIFFVKV